MKLFLPIFFFVASLGIFIFYVNPTYQGIKVKSAQAADLIQANNDAAQLRAVREKLLTQMNGISSTTKDKLLKALPESVENVGLIININNIAQQYGMNIKNARINDTVGTSVGGDVGPSLSKYGSLALSFTVSTNYTVFLAFLNDLQSSLRLVDVTALSFTSNDTGKNDFNVTIQTYWLK